MIARHPLEVRTIIDSWKRLPSSIVLTGGTFDWLHYGHIRCFQESLAIPRLQFGDPRDTYLIVAVNTDISLRQCKGREPLISQEMRIATLDALSAVDLVIPFSNPTPIQTIRVVRPNYYVKGEEYEYEDLPEKDILEELDVKYVPCKVRIQTRTSELWRKLNDGEERN